MRRGGGRLTVARYRARRRGVYGAKRLRSKKAVRMVTLEYLQFRIRLSSPKAHSLPSCAYSGA